MSDIDDSHRPPCGQPVRHGSAPLRILAAVAFAAAFLFGAYLLIEAARPDGGLVSFTFLLVLPAAICAFVAYVADPWAERSIGFYFKLPFWLLLTVILLSIPLLKEGVICVIILSPLWIGSGLVGVAVTYRMRRRVRDGRTYCLSLLALPLIGMQVEPMIPLPYAAPTVTRSIIVDASPERIWPLLRGIPDVRPGEGAWNITQDVLGVPRPLGARLVGNGIGAVRLANWGQDIRFSETIIDWRMNRHIGWTFRFDRIDGWKLTDRHLMPNSPYFRITTGGYRMEPLADGRTRVTLDTSYRLRTPVNGYSRLWGEFFLGDLENNLLALVKQRAERGASTSKPLAACPIRPDGAMIDARNNNMSLPRHEMWKSAETL